MVFYIPKVIFLTNFGYAEPKMHWLEEVLMETPLLFRQFVGLMYYDSLVAKDRRS